MFQFSIQPIINPLMGWVSLQIIAVFIIVGSLLGLWHAYTHDPVITHHVPQETVILSRDADHIFGVYPIVRAQGIDKLLVKGIFAADNPEEGAAIIAKKGQTPKLYVVGDKLPGGTQLVAVRETEIEVDAGGERSIVRLPEKHLNKE